MTIAEQINLLANALRPWAKANSGHVMVASDALDCFELLRTRPGTPTCAVLWYGREPMGEIDRLGKKINQFKIVVSRGRSLKLIPGESLTEGAAGGAPMFNLVEQAEAIALSVRQDLDEDADPEDALPVHLGTGPFEVNGILLDAIEIRLSLVAQAPVQTLHDESGEINNV